MCAIARYAQKVIPHTFSPLCNLPFWVDLIPRGISKGKACIILHSWVTENMWQPHPPPHLSNIVRWAKNKLVPYLGHYISVDLFVIAASLLMQHLSYPFHFLLPLSYLPWNSPTCIQNYSVLGKSINSEIRILGLNSSPSFHCSGLDNYAYIIFPISLFSTVEEIITQRLGRSYEIMHITHLAPMNR